LQDFGTKQEQIIRDLATALKQSDSLLNRSINLNTDLLKDSQEILIISGLLFAGLFCYYFCEE
jgi:hypothetical protein